MIYDALVIGGGPAGATAAWLLAQAGWSVALLEKASFPRRKVCGEFISATNLPLLRVLGIEKIFLDLAGPPLSKIGIYSGKHTLAAPMSMSNAAERWGRALGREYLDTLLLDGARQAGADIRQPCNAISLLRENGVFICLTTPPNASADTGLNARVVIAAHGSCETRLYSTHTPGRPLQASDLIAFKAHFLQADLPADILPVLAFPGGYGGMLQTDHGRICMAFCIRRDVLQRLRGQTHHRAAEAALAYIMEHCTSVHGILDGAHMQGEWLSTGTVRPGIRILYNNGIFAVGNAAAEAHPIIGEGISMAMQGAWLLSEILLARRAQVLCGDTAAAGRAFARAWRRLFTPRLYSAALFAHLAMRPAATKLLLPLFQHIPELLTFCTRLSGKTTKVISVYS
jgi:flavin-dependent dehydrogenase